MLALLIRKIGILIACHSQKSQSLIAKKLLPHFGNNPKNVNIDLPRNIVNPERIFLGDDIYLGPNCLLIALKEYPGPTMEHPEKKGVKQRFDSKITIGNGSQAPVNCRSQL